MYLIIIIGFSIILLSIWLYIMVRLCSSAIFRSWYDIVNQKLKEKADDSKKEIKKQ